MYSVSQKFLPATFSGNISPKKENFRNLHVYCMQNFIQLLSTLTKLCHIKHGHLANFYISLEKCEKLQYLCNSMTNVSVSGRFI